MILTSNRGFAEWRHLRRLHRRYPCSSTASLHHAVVLQIEGSSYRLREHADLLPEHIRTKANIRTLPIPSTLKRRGRPPNNGGAVQQRLIPEPAKLGNFAAPASGCAPLTITC